MVSVTSALALLSAGLYLDGRTRFSRDLNFGLPGLRTKLWFERLVANNDVSFYNRFEDQCRLRPYAIALVFEGHSYTWRDLELASNKLAHWYQAQGIAPKDRVAMFMTNSPLFIISWLALLKIKAVGAFINNQITGTVLLHSLKTANAQLLIFDYTLVDPLQKSNAEIKEMGYRLFTITPQEEVLVRFDEHDRDPSMRFFEFMNWRECSSEGYSRESRKDVVIEDAAALIYTSGTTGFPKAAIMDHGRCTLAVGVWSGICKITEKDRVYDCLPLYHSAGAIIGIGQSWISGSTIVLARKFSTTYFWKEVREQEVTLIQYIGELCRYLLNAPESPLDKANKVRMIFGNGLRPDVWRKFQERFDIPTVFEFYTMSEATSALFNLNSGEDGAGAVGFRGPLVRKFQPGLRIVKVDLDTEELIRDKNGYCIECEFGETGELLTLADNKTSQSRYIGYFNQPKMSSAKLIQNAFEPGDQYMRTGDLLYRTRDHFWYFADRAGDTFRWKGENVSTAEVADTLGRVEGIASCTVYGVTVPGQDGRAGMAAVVLKDGYWEPEKEKDMLQGIPDSVLGGDNSVEGNPDAPEKGPLTTIGMRLNEKVLEEFMDRLSTHAKKSLPAYAIPRFVRICEGELEVTGTFKNKKVELKKEGFDLSMIQERLYWWTPEGRYSPFGHAENKVILAGRARL
ncbi:hypothetical protein BC939DRAFT_26967 [Gamsiella multidivaricata]|uniref:uncharacterized protein n=1 Tax=Gamsiella multidivaricata TaxID=101098 RepID=UPI00222078E4|nr:uncharacterized protein BC939DRAFT_26967 [Gamsiella multidivaricata]KAG0367771.1 hypothetical protein BGZ54_003264 [Gamsiella multidivaricata]KAI7829451.1 hypothetical protein BC939DRAFT_26967 [Gamsiella multidivaricata]